MKLLTYKNILDHKKYYRLSPVSENLVLTDDRMRAKVFSPEEVSSLMRAERKGVATFFLISSEVV